MGAVAGSSGVEAENATALARLLLAFEPRAAAEGACEDGSRHGLRLVAVLIAVRAK